MLNYHYLRYFWAVAHEGNLTRAARIMHVSQSALSVQIQKLESELGHALFERRGKKLILTEAGRVALEHADAIFATGDELLQTLSGSGVRARQVLRVGALATLSRNFQINFFEPLLRRQDVELVVRSGAFGELLQSLEAYQLDVVLANSAPARDAATQWVPHAIDEQPVSLIGRPGIVSSTHTLAEIFDRHSMVLPTTDSSIRTGFDALVVRMGVVPRIVAEVDDMAMLRLIAREHSALAVVPPIVVKDELDRGELVEIRRLPDLSESFVAITSSRRFQNPILADLLERTKLERGQYKSTSSK